MTIKTWLTNSPPNGAVILGLHHQSRNNGHSNSFLNADPDREERANVYVFDVQRVAAVKSLYGEAIFV